jgi:hypothetical protein
VNKSEAGRLGAIARNTLYGPDTRPARTAFLGRFASDEEKTKYFRDLARTRWEAARTAAMTE